VNEIWITSHVLMWIAVIAEGVLLLAVMRQVGSLLLRVGTVRPFDAGYGPGVGDQAPWLPDRELDDQRKLLLAFLSTTCGTCDALIPALNAIGSSYADVLDVAVVAREKPRVLHPWASRKGLSPRAIAAEQAFDLFLVDGTPYAFVVSGEGAILARGGVNHIEHLESLIRQCGIPDTKLGDEKGSMPELPMVPTAPNEMHRI
jgi:methylamine dehydrogenase accessory protein MauD